MTDAAYQTSNNNASLEGALVVELGSRVGTGVCGSLLSQLGATVVLVEHADERPERKWRQRALCAAGKLSVRIDRNSPSDCELLADVIRRSDVILQSSDADVASTGPIGDTTTQIICDVTAYGRTGALAGRADTDWQIQALTGIVATTGTGDNAPVPVPLPIVEYMTGVYAAAATTAALRLKNATGRGQQVDMALYDCAFASMATFLPRVLTGSKDPIPRIGNRHPLIAPWNVYEARDGWILICVGSDAQWQRVCDLMGRPELKDAPFATTADRVANVTAVDAAMQAWVGNMTIAECATLLNKAQIACGPIVRIENGRPQEPNLDHRGMIERANDPVGRREIFLSASPLRMSASPGRVSTAIPAPDSGREKVRSMVSAVRKPNHPTGALPSSALEGVRIVEIGHYTTIPLSARVLAGLGADVIKIEPPGGEATRPWPPTQGGQGYFFTYMNSDKRSVVLDLRKDADAEHLRDLIRDADVLMENLKPGALAARGFSAKEVAALNPRLIFCSVSGFGADSLYSGRPAYDSVVQAMSGLMDILRANDVPMKTGASIADLLGAEMAVLAVLAALAYRDRTGEGQYIDLSMQDIASWLTEPAWNDGSGSPPLSVLSCHDGFLLAEGSATELETAGFPARLMGRLRNDVASQLTRSGIRSAPVLGVHEMVSATQTISRQLWHNASKDGLTWPLLANPLRLEGTPPQTRTPMPALGSDNESILKRRTPSMLQSPGTN
jgi:crotonobetainyl-CoA:carnitine CoA-transferase CaiB-like acyl-CoA transferase